MWHRYSKELRQAVLTAATYAEGRGECDISTRHLLLGLWGCEGSSSTILRRLGVDQTAFEDAYDNVDACEKPLNAPEPTLTREARAVVDAAYVLAVELGDGHVGDEHLLLSILREPADNDAACILARLGVTWEKAGKALVDVQPNRLRAPAGVVDSRLAGRRVKDALAKSATKIGQFAWATVNYRKHPFLPYLMFRKRTLDNPYPFYAGLRKKPIYFDALINNWVVSGYKEVTAVLQDPRFSHQQFTLSTWDIAELPPLVGREFRWLNSRMGTQMLFLDAPRQTRLRSLVSKQFTPRVIAGLESMIQQITDELLEAPAKKGHLEVIADLAFPLPSTVIARMLGVSEGDSAALKKWSDDFATYIGGETTLAQDHAAYLSMRELTPFFQAEIDKRRQTPSPWEGEGRGGVRTPLSPEGRGAGGEGFDDVISLLIRAEDNGDRLTDDEIIANCLLMLAAGHETTTQLIGNGLFALLRNPAQFAKLRENPDLIGSAVEELLRYDSPVQWTSRVTREDFEWNGHKFKKAQLINICLAGANHDPEQFPDPDTLDITREQGRHLAFGYGPHFCLGAALARLEGQIAFRTLVERFPNMRLSTKNVNWRGSFAFRSLQALHVELL